MKVHQQSTTHGISMEISCGSLVLTVLPSDFRFKWAARHSLYTITPWNLPPQSGQNNWSADQLDTGFVVIIEKNQQVCDIWRQIIIKIFITADY